MGDYDQIPVARTGPARRNPAAERELPVMTTRRHRPETRPSAGRIRRLRLACAVVAPVLVASPFAFAATSGPHAPAAAAASGQSGVAAQAHLPVGRGNPHGSTYLVGIAQRDITPVGVINLGGYGLSDGSVIPSAVIGRGGRDSAKGEHISARALAVDDGKSAIVIADIETQGYFTAYEEGPYGLADMAAAVAKARPRLRADHILIAADHTHAGPDTIGAWGGVDVGYLQRIKDQTVAAIIAAYDSRLPARIVAGQSDASDLIYNQACSEALNQSKQPSYTGPDLCAVPGKDGIVRVLQARTLRGSVIATYMAYAAHGTAGGGIGVNGDWPQFLADAMTKKFGGIGLAMVGALGGTQPCRPACSFTKPSNPGYTIADRKSAIVANYLAHVEDALRHATAVHGPVAAAQSYLREPIVTPTVLALFTAGNHDGAKLLRSHEPPYMVGNTIRTVASALRIGGVLFAGTPGEGFPAIGAGVRGAVSGYQEVIQLGLANDQLGYLISPVTYVPVIAAEVGVNDNIIFNVSPTIGDHVMCADIVLALRIGFGGSTPPQCAGYDTADSQGDPLGSVPVGGVIIP